MAKRQFPHLAFRIVSDQEMTEVTMISGPKIAAASCMEGEISKGGNIKARPTREETPKFHGIVTPHQEEAKSCFNEDSGVGERSSIVDPGQRPPWKKIFQNGISSFVCLRY